MNYKFFKRTISYISMIMVLVMVMLVCSPTIPVSAEDEIIPPHGGDSGLPPLSALTVIEFDISKGSVSLKDDTYSGYDSTGNESTGEHSNTNYYVISQSNATTPTTNTISIGQTDSSANATAGKTGTAATKTFFVKLNGVNIQNSTDRTCAFSVNVADPGRAIIILGDSTNNILYSGACRAGLEKSGGATSNGLMLLTCEEGYEAWRTNMNEGHVDKNHYSGCTSSCGSLDAKSGNGWNNKASQTYIAGAGIGTAGYGKNGKNSATTKLGTNALINFTIAGGFITGTGAYGTSSSTTSGGSAGIGTGSAMSSGSIAGNIIDFKITGGTVTGVRGCCSAANIGGGYRGGYVSMTIFGGTIDGTELSYSAKTTPKGASRVSGTMRAAAIGGGGGGTTSSSPAGATVIIYNGKIDAYGQYGSAIGSGAGGGGGDGNAAIVKIYNGNISAKTEIGTTTSGKTGTGAGAAIGAGGSLGNGSGGKATVIIKGGTITASSAFGADIGGGGTQGAEADNNGGAGYVTIEGGTITTEINGIGGGRAKAGNGGYAEITVTGGTVKTPSIGGGESVDGNGGNASVTVHDGYLDADYIGGGNTKSTINSGGSITRATPLTDGTVEGIYFTGGTVRTGAIGGGSNGANQVGYATARVTGGDIRGQFVMKASSLGDCSFTMTGGWLHGTDLFDTNFTHGQKDGGALWMDDPNGVATVSGGTIESCSATNGGAVYMTAGSFTLSGTGIIRGCTASQNGGAIYLGKKNDSTKGTFTMNGGTLSGNIANENGGGVYLNGGNATVNNGSILGNQATNGGGAYLNGGMLTIAGGTLESNIASQNGGGAYVHGGSINMMGGIFAKNIAQNGGGAYVEGGSIEMTDGCVGGATEASANIASQNGGGFFVNGGNVDLIAGDITFNKASQNGGGVAVNNGNFTMHSGNVNGNKALSGLGGGIYVTSEDADPVAVTVYSGSVSNNASANNGGAIAVVGLNNATKTITVTIGANIEHTNIDGIWQCNHCDCHQSKTCPVLVQNTTGEEGGAIYITGSLATALNLYCLDEHENTAENAPESTFLKVDGGKVVMTCASENTQTDEYGWMHVEGTIHVTGGQMEIWGSMMNPKIDGIITVDIKKDGDYFRDNRYNDAGDPEYYKLQYFENFEDPETGLISGQFKAFQFTKEELLSHKILGVIYNHPGYEIDYWKTQKDDPPNDTGDIEVIYHVGQTIEEIMKSYLGEGATTPPGLGQNGDDYLLRIYAMWNANGYYVQFNANANPYTGTMEQVTFTYDKEENLPLNAFGSVGNRFVRWNTKADGSGTYYTDGQKVKNLAQKKGDVVVLYAIWVECKHDQSIYFSYSAAGATLTRSCDCLGFTDSIELQAQDTTYNKNPHPVEQKYSGSKDIGSWDTLILTYIRTDQDPNTESTDAPTNAGSYTATLYVDGHNNADRIAKISYIIRKAPQTAPTKPEYDALKDSAIIKIHANHSANTDYYENAKAEYQVRYYDGSGELKVYQNKWFSIDTKVDGFIEIPMETAWTNYYVVVRYEETENYLPSDDVFADASFFFDADGKITVKITQEDGITYIYKPSSSTIRLDPITVNEQFFRKNGDRTTITVKKVYDNTGTEGEIANTSVSHVCTEGNESWILNDILVETNSYTITIHIGGVQKKASGSISVTPGEEFDALSDTETTISQDSAFSMHLTVSDFDTTQYKDLILTFNQNLPVGTTLLVMKKSDTTAEFWHVTLGTASDSIELKRMAKIGTSDMLEVTEGTMEFRVIVDFSNVADDKKLSTTLEVSLSTKERKDCFLFTTAKNVGVKKIESPSIEQHQGPAESLNVTLSAQHNPSQISASKWEGRVLTIKLTPSATAGAALPADAELIVLVNNTTKHYSLLQGGYFLIEVGDYASLNARVTVTLSSEMFPAGRTEYKFDAMYLISETASESALNGIEIGTNTFSFVKAEEQKISVSVNPSEDFDGQKIFKPDMVVPFVINYSNVPETASVKIVLERKNDENGEYSSTGWSMDIAQTGDYRVNLAGQQSGSYRVNVIVQAGDKMTVLASTQYYLIIE